MPTRTAHPFEHAVQRANEWLADVAHEFDTDDYAFAYRVTRAWLHGIRDQLPVVEAAHFGAQLPEVLRGVYYEGWNPSLVPIDGTVEDFVTRFAEDARVARIDVPKIIWAVSSAFAGHLSILPKALEHMPRDIRPLLKP